MSTSPTSTLARPLGIPTATNTDGEKAQFNAVLPGVIAASIALAITAGVLGWMHYRRKKRRRDARKRVSMRQQANSRSVMGERRDGRDQNNYDGRAHARTTSADAGRLSGRLSAMMGGGRQRGSRLYSPEGSDVGLGVAVGSGHRQGQGQPRYQEVHEKDDNLRPPMMLQMPEKGPHVGVSIDDPITPGPHVPTLHPTSPDAANRLGERSRDRDYQPRQSSRPRSPAPDHDSPRKSRHELSPGRDRDRDRDRDLEYDDRPSTYIRPGSFVGIERWVMAVAAAGPEPPESPALMTEAEDTETDAYSETTHEESTRDYTHASQMEPVKLDKPPLAGARTYVQPHRTTLSTASSMIRMSSGQGVPGSPFASPSQPSYSRSPSSANIRVPTSPETPGSFSTYPFPVRNTYDHSGSLQSPDARASSNAADLNMPRSPFSDVHRASGPSSNERARIASNRVNMYDPDMPTSPQTATARSYHNDQGQTLVVSPTSPTSQGAPTPRPRAQTQAAQGHGRRLSYKRTSRSLSAVYRDPEGDAESVAPAPSSIGRPDPAPAPQGSPASLQAPVPDLPRRGSETGSETDGSLSVMGDPSVWPQPPPSVLSDRSGREALGETGMNSDANGMRLSLGLGPPGWEGLGFGLGLDSPEWGRRPGSSIGARAGSVRSNGSAAGHRLSVGPVNGLPISSQIPLLSPKSTIRLGSTSNSDVDPRRSTGTGTGTGSSPRRPRAGIVQETDDECTDREEVIRPRPITAPRPSVNTSRSSDQPASPVTPSTPGTPWTPGSSNALLGDAWSPGARSLSLATTAGSPRSVSPVAMKERGSSRPGTADTLTSAGLSGSDGYRPPARVTSSRPGTGTSATGDRLAPPGRI